MMLTDKIDQLLKEVSTLSAKNAEDVEQLRLKYLSKKGEINAIIADFRNVAKEQKRELGIKINELKTAATEKINALREQVETTETGSESLDLTRTAYPVALGTRHPLTLVQNEIIDIFSAWGSRSFKDQRLMTTSTYSPCSTSRPTIQHATCRIRSSYRRTPAM